jgi:WD repeat-containing protein 68
MYAQLWGYCSIIAETRTDPIYALDWSEPQVQRPRTSFRLAIGSFVEDFRNRISIIGLIDDRCLLEDEMGPYTNSVTNGYSSPAPTAQDFTVLAEATHGYPASKIAWQPIKAYQLNGGMNERGEPRELLASTSDGLRIWEYVIQDASTHGSYIGKAVTPAPGTGRLTQRVSLTGVNSLHI